MVKLPFFGKKKKKKKEMGFGYEGKEKGKKKIPVNEVINMRSRGMNNNQIITQLKTSGYDFSQIQEAMSQADLKGDVTNNPAPAFPGNQGGLPPPPPQEKKPSDLPAPPGTKQKKKPDIPPPPGAGKEKSNLPPIQEPSPQFNRGAMPPPSPGQPGQLPAGSEIDELERILEQIIEEKWKDITPKINKIDNWKSKVETRIDFLEDRIKELKKSLEHTQSVIMGKAEEYGRAVEDSRTEMKAIEKLMGKLVPTLTENIQELREMVDEKKK